MQAIDSEDWYPCRQLTRRIGSVQAIDLEERYPYRPLLEDKYPLRQLTWKQDLCRPLTEFEYLSGLRHGGQVFMWVADL